MHKAHFLLLFLCLFSSTIRTQEEDEEEQEIFLETHSFREPLSLTTAASIPYWDFGGSTIITESFVRLTPKDQSRAGWMWNHTPLKSRDWVVRLRFNAGGGGVRGGDGFALWYTKNPLEKGPTFGQSSSWEGLGIFFDTYDNDEKGDSPSVVAIYNRNNDVYDPNDDGAGLAIAKCTSAFRDRITLATLRYVDRRLELVIDVGSRTAPRVCFSVPIDLPRGFYLGLSAATGQVVDNHDILFLTTHRIKRVAVLQEDEVEPVRKKKIVDISPDVNSNGNANANGEQPLQPKKKQKKRVQHVHGDPNNEGHLNRAMKDLADFEARQEPNLLRTGETGAHHPDIPTYRNTAPDNIALLSELSVQLNWLFAEQNNTIYSLLDVEDSMKSEKDLMNNQHKEFAANVALILKSLATKTDVKQLLGSHTAICDNNFFESLVALYSDIESLRNSIKKGQGEVSESLKKFDQSLSSVTSTMDVVSKDQKQVAESLRQASHQLSISVGKHSKFGLLGYLLLLQVLVGIVAFAADLYKVSSRARV